jgi:hypothetical protein
VGKACRTAMTSVQLNWVATNANLESYELFAKAITDKASLYFKAAIPKISLVTFWFYSVERYWRTLSTQGFSVRRGER